MTSKHDSDEEQKQEGVKSDRASLILELTLYWLMMKLKNSVVLNT